MATSVDLAHRLLAAAENDQLMARSVLPVPGDGRHPLGFRGSPPWRFGYDARPSSQGS
ncbi:MAG TPA: hypothetical protein VMU32_08860 [Solirubrobacteraceae bacterium]|nr:hypothetical protein [Solirubrobacteraceae bacterium]